MEVNQLLEERGAIYGSYSNGVWCRGMMLTVLRNQHESVQGTVMSNEDQIMFGDILLKIMRAASNPSYLDSWADLEGYARLIKEKKMKEQESE